MALPCPCMEIANPLARGMSETQGTFLRVRWMCTESMPALNKMQVTIGCGSGLGVRICRWETAHMPNKKTKKKRAKMSKPVAKNGRTVKSTPRKKLAKKKLSPTTKQTKK